MAFSYTDDAIVSASPTGRHLSTVIKRPVVMMSGWDEHAEAVCKVLNELSASDSIGKVDFMDVTIPGLGTIRSTPFTWPTSKEAADPAPVEVTADMASSLYHARPGTTWLAGTTTLKRV